MKLRYYIILPLICFTLCFVSCSDDNEYKIPEGITELQNDCIKRGIKPNLVGDTIQFAYAMALPKGTGHLVSARAEASIPGDPKTSFNNKSYHTSSGGMDIGVEVAGPSVNEGKMTEITFTTDTCAATLRYYYVIPEEARGKQVSFKFYASDSNGRQVSYNMGPYNISNMDKKLDIVLSNESFFSIEDMAVYDKTAAAANPEKMDLVYIYKVIRGIDYAHSLVSPGADSQYFQGVTMPEGVNNSTKFWKVYASADQDLARDEYGVFVDDLDLQKITFTNAPDFGINMTQKSGAWVETSDGRYRAYFYVNAVNNGKKTMTISIKRLKVK